MNSDLRLGESFCNRDPNGRIALNIAKLPELLQRRSVILNASASGISCTPAVGSALLAHAGSGLADTVDHYPARVGATASGAACATGVACCVSCTGGRAAVFSGPASGFVQFAIVCLTSGDQPSSGALVAIICLASSP